MIKENESIRPFVFLSFLITVFWLISIGALYQLFSNWPERGTFGDSFGAVNALFSGLALAGIIYTILLQKKELKLQREELKLTRVELKRTAKAQENSEKALFDQANSLQVAAELNALNTILQGRIAKLNMRVQKGGSGQPELTEVEAIIAKIEALIKNT